MSLSEVREAEIEGMLATLIVARGGKALKLKWLGGVGWPDRTVLMPGGKIAFVELKRPVGAKAGPLQYWWRTWLIDNGFRVEHLRTFEEVERFVCSL